MGNCESDVLRPLDGGLVGRSLKAYRSVHLTGRGWGDVGILGVYWAQWTASFSEVPKPRSMAHIDRDPRAEGRDLLLNVEYEPQ